MSTAPGPSAAGQRYKSALAAHYTAKNLREALELYKAILSGFPDSDEAGFARSQIQNIVRAVVPEQVLFDLQANLALTYFEPVAQA
jgi:hypothetical protein